MITVDPRQRATLDEVKHHPWVNEGFESVPESFVPLRSAISLDKINQDVINMLLSFGYKTDDVTNGLIDKGNNPIKSTYHLIEEMFVREKRSLHRKPRTSLPTSITRPVAASEATLMLHAATPASQHEDDLPLTGQPADQARAQAEEQAKAARIAAFTSMPVGLNHNARHEETAASESRSEQQAVSISSAMVAGQDAVRAQASTSSGSGTSTSNASTRASSSAIADSAKKQSSLSRRLSARPTFNSSQTNASSQQNKLRRNSTQSQATPAHHTSQPAPVVHQSPHSPVSNSFPSTTAKPSSTGALVPGEHHHAASSSVGGSAEPRSVSGWFVTFSTTSEKPAKAVLEELQRVLQNNHVTFVKDPKSWVIHCATLEEGNNPHTESHYTLGSQQTVSGRTTPSAVGDSNEIIAMMSSARRGSLLTIPSHRKIDVEFQIEICRVPRLNLHGVVFKRMSGSVWNYKKLSSKIISEVVL